MNAPGFLFDANIWVGLAFAAHPSHAKATTALRAATAERPAYFCRATQQSTLRLLSTPAILRVYGVPGLSNRDALATLDRFMASPSVAYREEPPGVVSIWHHLAALPSAAQLEMVTFDQGFSQFAGMSVTILAPATPTQNS
ncbi:MAG TPA: hypothetical protein VIL86_12995 [Tepidisphaeraceae bacterium]